MELGKPKLEASTRNTLWNEKLKVPSEFLRFTFVPSFGSLPTQFYIADATTFLAEGPVDRNSREISGHKAEAVPGGQAVGSGNKGNGGSASCTNSHHKLFQAKDHKASRGEMEGDDLFKAEFVFITDSDEDKNTPLGNGYGHGRSKGLDPSCLSPSGESRGHPTAPQLPLNTEISYSSVSQQKHSQSHKIKTSYKAFAAIPTNTLLLEQKALDEPAKAEEVAENKALDTHSEMCSPAQLRQQTEELCAAIDQVLQDPLSMRRCDSSPGSLQNILDSDAGKTLMSSQRPAGRETRFANLRSLQSAAPEKQKTKPGVIRPTMVKAKIITLKEEEPAQPNPFRKYLEETGGLQTEQDPSLSHPYLYTKLSSPTKSPLHPQGLSHADLLTPGPFNHLGTIFGDIHDSSYSPYRRNALYNKPTHPIVPIPENEALSSKELCSARAQNKLDLLPYQENKDLSRGNFPDNGSPHSRAQCLPRGDFENVFAKTT
ncbi:muscular LMNA-interacting protein isoform X4 [Zootoca vivipara]|uniref:muscular LMNA-interacting protein isoform X4 n=1 Tax=Zootoca vivipara TaxID=8524 RepID=UPI0015912927|nr:muscular LMNA-interacting protein isoform X4 [Zootoca vivipara]